MTDKQPIITLIGYDPLTPAQAFRNVVKHINLTTFVAQPIDSDPWWAWGDGNITGIAYSEYEVET